MFLKVGISVALIVAMVAAFAEAKYSNFVVEKAMTYAEAVEHCQSLEHDLINVESPSKQAEVYKMVKAREFRRIWLGINRRNDTEDNLPFEWHYERIPLQPIRAVFWAQGEPNNKNNNEERCVEMLDRHGDPRYTPDANWNDRNCNEKSPFICERY